MAERVLVIGAPGSGKSTLARTLAARTGLPLHHLDRLYWQPGWVEPDKAEWQARVAALAAEPRWIIDGNYSDTLEPRLARAELVVLLDFAPLRCTWRILDRTRRDHGRVRADVAEGCPERFNPGFLWYVLSFRLRRLPRTEAKLAGYAGALVRLGTPREMARYLGSGERPGEHRHR